MYAKNITIKKFSDSTLPLNEKPVTDLIRSDKNHRFSTYDCVYVKSPHETYCMPMREIAYEFGEIAANAISYLDATSEQISSYKKQVPVAVFSELEGGRKNRESFLTTSLIAVDVDQKGIDGESFVSVEVMLQRLANLRLSAVLYTTFSYRPVEPCYRILIDLGRDCSWDDYHRSCAWLRKNLLVDLCELGVVDGVSWSPVQPMALPYGYRYQKPVVELIQGYGLWNQYSDDLAQFEIPRLLKTGKREKVEIGTQNLTNQSENLFVDQVEYLHKKLKFFKRTSSSFQFWRSTQDINAGLFCRLDWKDIYDPAKGDRYSLQYAVTDFEEALNHKPTPREHRIDAIRDWIKSDTPYALFNENCGTGKSEVLKSLSSDSPINQRYVFTFLTISNRDEFEKKAQNAIIVNSTSEIIVNVLGKERAKAVFDVFTRYYDSRNALIEPLQERSRKNKNQFVANFIEKELDKVRSNVSMTEAMRQCSQAGLIDENEFNEIRREYGKNKIKLTNEKHLLMTTKKFEFLMQYSKESIFEKDVIFTDEHQLGMLTNIDTNKEYEIYGNFWRPKKQDDVDREKLHALKRCIVTSEMVASCELHKNKIEFRDIATVGKTPDFGNLEILLVPSTSSSENEDGQTNRQRIKCAVDRAINADATVIGDKIDADYNLINCKGSNDLREKNTVIILSLPAVEELAHTMACTDLGLSEATSLIMSDKANQAIGRNQGYRNKDEYGNPSSGNNHCLLVLPKKAIDIDLHYVTSKVVNAKHWLSSNRGIKTSDRKKNNFYYRKVIDQIALAI